MTPNTFALNFSVERQPEGGYVITSPTFPELLTEADTLPELVERLRGALLKVLDYHAMSGMPLPLDITLEEQDRRELVLLADMTNHHMWENPLGTGGAITIPDLGDKQLKPRLMSIIVEKLGVDPSQF